MKFDVLPIQKLEASWLPLVDAAFKIQSRAYAPYSRFHVASAIEDENGKMHLGVNVENSSFSGTICAERNAAMQMIVEGGKKIKRIVVVTPTDTPNFPCGACLQVIQEFQADTVVVGVNGARTLFSKASLSELFPAAFTPERLRGKE